MIVTIFRDLLKTTDVPYHVNIDKVFDRIKIGKSKDKIELIRNGDKETKKKLPCILFSGTFSERNANGLIEHSGLMVLDFDNIPPLQYDKVNENLKSNPFCFCTFRSPSGDGLKVVIKIDKCDKARHSKIFEQFSLDYSYDYLDKSGSDLSRVCFESYDPNIYINKDCDTYNPIIIDKGYQIKDRVPLIPITDNDIIINKIMEWNWSKDFREGERNAFVFDVASAFCEYGVDQTNAEYYIENNIIHGDFTSAEMVNTIKSAYRSRQFNCKYFENYEKINKIAIDIPKGRDVVTKKYNVSDEIFEEIEGEDEEETKMQVGGMARKKVGEPTGEMSEAGRPLYKTAEGEIVSEKSITVPYKDGYVNVPSIQDGIQYEEDEIEDMLASGKIKPTSTHNTLEEAVEAAKQRSNSLIKMQVGGMAMPEGMTQEDAASTAQQTPEATPTGEPTLTPEQMAKIQETAKDMQNRKLNIDQTLMHAPTEGLTPSKIVVDSLAMEGYKGNTDVFLRSLTVRAAKKEAAIVRFSDTIFVGMPVDQSTMEVHLFTKDDPKKLQDSIKAGIQTLQNVGTTRIQTTTKNANLLSMLKKLQYPMSVQEDNGTFKLTMEIGK